jgi:hypothetical protein
MAISSANNNKIKITLSKVKPLSMFSCKLSYKSSTKRENEIGEITSP